MHEDDIAVFGLVEHFLGYLERSQHTDSFRNLILFTHGSPDVGVQYVCTLQASLIGGYFDGCAGVFRNFSCSCDHVVVDLVSQLLRTVSNEVHTHLRTAVHPCVSHIVSDIAAEYHFHLVQRFCDMFFDG